MTVIIFLYQWHAVLLHEQKTGKYKLTTTTKFISVYVTITNKMHKFAPVS